MGRSLLVEEDVIDLGRISLTSSERSRGGNSMASHTIEYRLKGLDDMESVWVESCFVLDEVSKVVHVVTRDIDARRELEKQRAEIAENEAAKATVQR